MIKEIVAAGKDVAEAKENARAALHAGPLDDVTFEVIHFGSKGILGIIGVKPAQVKASMEVPDAPERRPRRENKPENRNENKQNRPENKQNGQKKDRPAQKKPNAPKSAPKAAQDNKPKAAAIPETELKFEKMVVGEGEDMSFEFVKTLLSDLGLDAEAELFSCEDGTRRINISGNDASALIGHHGDTLDALQYLTNLASARKNVNGERNKSRVTIDIEGYRAKREETLRALARRMAAKALRNKRSVMLEPMTPYERRIIHSEIQGIEGVSTNSIGSDNNRKIVIYLTDKKPVGLFEEDEEPTAETPIAEEFAPVEEDAVQFNDRMSVSLEPEDDADSNTVVKSVSDDASEDESV